MGKTFRRDDEYAYAKKNKFNKRRSKQQKSSKTKYEPSFNQEELDAYLQSEAQKIR